MAGKHRGDKSKGGRDKGEHRRSNGSQHVHNYTVTRQEKRGKFTYVFMKCTNPNCPEPDKMDIQ